MTAAIEEILSAPSSSLRMRSEAPLTLLAISLIGFAAIAIVMGVADATRVTPRWLIPLAMPGALGLMLWALEAGPRRAGQVVATVAGVVGIAVTIGIFVVFGLKPSRLSYDFTPLRAALTDKARAVVLIGRDAPLIAAALGDSVPLQRAADLEQAVALAAQLAAPGDSVLLSPACASFDMFSGYEQRGALFAAAVRRLAGC